jgi:hypothetical protein
MKQDKGEAAFDSVDEVLAEKIVVNSKNHGEKAPENPETPSAQIPLETPAGKKPARSTGRWIIAAVIAAAVLILGCLCFGKCGKYCKKYWGK